jgi:uncharacterized membrane protein YdcZ (DUF606 family)
VVVLCIHVSFCGVKAPLRSPILIGLSAISSHLLPSFLPSFLLGSLFPIRFLLISQPLFPFSLAFKTAHRQWLAGWLGVVTVTNGM